MRYIHHTPCINCDGYQVVVASGAANAKGLLMSCIQDKDPCIFLEPKVLYRSSVEQVPDGKFTMPLGKAQIVIPGNLSYYKICLYINNKE